MVKYYTLKLFFVFVFLLCGKSMMAQTLEKMNVHACEPSREAAYFHPNQLISSQQKEDTLFLQIGLVRNCGFGAHVDLAYQADSLILNIVDKSTVFDACECFFKIDLKITGIEDTNFTIYYNHERLEFVDSDIIEISEIRELKHHPSKYIFPTPAYLNADSAKNELSISGSRIGHWRVYNEKSQIYQDAFYEIDEMGQSKVTWYMITHADGTILKICTSVLNENLGEVSYCIDYDEYLLLDF